MSSETGHVTGTKDKNYNLIWFTEQCLNNALRLQNYIDDAERDADPEVADMFRESTIGQPQGRRNRLAAAAALSVTEGDNGYRL